MIFEQPEGDHLNLLYSWWQGTPPHAAHEHVVGDDPSALWKNITNCES